MGGAAPRGCARAPPSGWAPPGARKLFGLCNDNNNNNNSSSSTTTNNNAYCYKYNSSSSSSSSSNNGLEAVIPVKTTLAPPSIPSYIVQSPSFRKPSTEEIVLGQEKDGLRGCQFAKPQQSVTSWSRDS